MISKFSLSVGIYSGGNIFLEVAERKVVIVQLSDPCCQCFFIISDVFWINITTNLGFCTALWSGRRAPH